MDEREYRLQLDGLAGALSDADVRAALLGFPGNPVAIAAFEWSAAPYQREIFGWRLVETDGDIAALAAALRGHVREASPQATAIGAALLHAEALLATGPACWRQTVDLSSDGTNNDYPRPRRVYRDGALAGVTVNVLAIGQDDERFDDRRNISIGELMAYFRANVIRGPGAFVQPAIGFDDFEAAMRQKLLRELAGVSVGAREAPARHAGLQ